MTPISLSTMPIAPVAGDHLPLSAGEPVGTTRPEALPVNAEKSGLAELKALFVALKKEEDDRSMSQIIIETFARVNARDEKKLQSLAVIQASRQAAIMDVAQIKNLVLMQKRNARLDLDRPFVAAKDSELTDALGATVTLRQAMTYYAANHKELGLPAPPASLGQLDDYNEMLDTAISGILAIASQLALTDLQDHMQRLHAMRDLQSALMKGVESVWSSVIRAM